MTSSQVPPAHFGWGVLGVSGVGGTVLVCAVRVCPVRVRVSSRRNSASVRFSWKGPVMAHGLVALKANSALIMECQKNEAWPGACSEPTLVHVTESKATAYVTCVRHGTYSRSERRTSLRVQPVENITVVN